MSLNTTPRTWVASELVTAALMNTEVRDALTGLQAAWDTYTPTLTATTTNPTLGNGTALAKYLRIGRTAMFQAAWTFGSTSTVGSGSYLMALPVTADAVGFDQTVVVGFFDASAARHYVGKGLINSGGATIVRFHLEGGNALGSATPVVPATGDVIYAAGTIAVA